MTDGAEAQSEFQRLIKVDEIETRGTDMTVEANEAERAALADRFRILAIDTLRAKVRAVPVDGSDVELSGTVTARVAQACVVSNEPVIQEISESFEIRYSPDAEEVELPDPDGMEEIDPAMYDLPEPLIDGVIDVGEAVAQEVALCLDPYPRRPDAVLTHESVVSEEDAKAPSPFAKLAVLKDRMKNNDGA